MSFLQTLFDLYRKEERKKPIRPGKLHITEKMSCTKT